MTEPQVPDQVYVVELRDAESRDPHSVRTRNASDKRPAMQRVNQKCEELAQQLKKPG